MFPHRPDGDWDRGDMRAGLVEMQSTKRELLQEKQLGLQQERSMSASGQRHEQSTAHSARQSSISLARPARRMSSRASAMYPR